MAPTRFACVGAIFLSPAAVTGQDRGRENVKIFWAIALGAAAGGVSRFYLGAAIQQHLGTEFPWGTLAINITGSLLLGVLIRYAMATPAIALELRAMLTVGVCGGYTTFSSYS